MGYSQLRRKALKNLFFDLFFKLKTQFAPRLQALGPSLDLML